MIMHVDEAVGIDRLIYALERARERARDEGRPVLASLVEPVPALDPLALFAAAATGTERSLWVQPHRRFALVGAGVAQVIEAGDLERFESTRQARRAVLDGAIVEGPSEVGRGTGPVLLGAFSFDPRRDSTAEWHGFPAARLILPRLLFTSHGDEHSLTLNSVVWPDGEPSTEARRLIDERDRWLDAARAQQQVTTQSAAVELHETRPAADWQQVVADASAAIRDGQSEKIVLAREVRLQSETPFEVAQALQRLAEAYPTCYVFAFGHDEKTFLGATPERLVHVEGGDLAAACLAGSERRGATPEEDQELGEALLASAKDREEHAIVVRALREGLADLCDRLIAPDEPELLSVSNVHHLYTPISARLREGVCILDAVERLHPTPAVGGYPRETALTFIREHEGMDRGWYASPIGWVGPDGGGEFAVALRSGLVDGSTAYLFAGCGIMGDSDPQREYDESWLKFRPMLSALGGELR